MGAANSTVIETDLSFKIVGNSGVGAGLLMPDAVRGPVDREQLITSQTELLDYMTFNDAVEVGFDNSYYSALAYLEQGNKLFVRRVVNLTDTYYSGFESETSAAPVTGTAVAGDTDSIELEAAPSEGDYVVITAGTGINQVRRVLSVLVNVATVVPWDEVPDNTSDYALYTPGLGLSGETMTDPTAYTFGGTAPLLITSADPGSWGNGLYVKIVPYFLADDADNPAPGTTDPFKVGEPGAFRIEVYKSSNLLVPIEETVCSRNPAHKDGFKQNIYMNNALESSMYIRGYDNVLVDEAVRPAYTPYPVQLTDGADGTAATDGDMIIALETFTNTVTIPIKVFMDGGRATAPYQSAITQLCEGRNDCIGLYSMPYAAENAAAFMSEIATYRLDTLNANTSFAAIYSSWVRIYDRFNSREIHVSPDGYAAATIAKAASNGEVWDAPAGENRGVLNVIGVLRNFTEGQMDILYDLQINPILQTQGSGIMIWGQRMLQSRPSDTDRMNVRLMLCEIEPLIKKYMRGFVFDSNNEQTRTLAKMGLDSFMGDIKARGGVYDFNVQCDKDNNNAAVISQNKMNVSVFVQVELAAEFITSNIIITPRGTSFAAAAALV